MNIKNKCGKQNLICDGLDLIISLVEQSTRKFWVKKLNLVLPLRGRTSPKVIRWFCRTNLRHNESLRQVLRVKDNLTLLAHFSNCFRFNHVITCIIKTTQFPH